MKEKGLNSAIVVTSPYHSRRVKAITKRLAAGIKILRICDFEKPWTNQEKWWSDEIRAKFIMDEYLILIWHYLFDKQH